MTDNATELESSIRDEVTQWFFDDYLTTWIGVGAGTIARGPEFILDYWGVPLYWGEDGGQPLAPRCTCRGGAPAGTAGPAA